MNKIFFYLLLCVVSTAHSAINLGQTRVIYNENDKAAMFDVNNNTDKPYMVQTWLDNGNPDETPANLPMLITPPILKLDGHKSAVLRAIYQGNGFPEDVESVAWINVQEIPTIENEENTLQLAQRIRIKLFYRPVGLNMTLPEAVEKLQWQCHGHTLRAVNATPLHISLTQLHINGQNIDADMINPHGERTFALSQQKVSHIGFSWVDDYGGTNAVNNVPVSCN